MTLSRLQPGSRWLATEMPELTGTLIRVGEGSALVDLDGERSFHVFESGGKTKCVEASGKRRTTITKALDVRTL